MDGTFNFNYTEIGLSAYLEENFGVPCDLASNSITQMNSFLHETKEVSNGTYMYTGSFKIRLLDLNSINWWSKYINCLLVEGLCLIWYAWITRSASGLHENFSINDFSELAERIPVN